MGVFENKEQDGVIDRSYTLDRNETIDRVVYGMISNNQIAGLIPCTLTQVDDRRVFHFNVSELTNLNERMERDITLKELLTFCISLIHSIQEMSAYMIDSKQILLSMDHMYMDEKSAQAHMIVLPVQLDSESDLQLFLRELFVNTHLHNEQENNDFTKLFQLLGKQFKADVFLRTAQDMQTRKKAAPPKAVVTKASPKIEVHQQQVEIKPVNIIPKSEAASFAVPETPVVEKPQKAKKKGLFSFGTKKEHAEPIKKEKPTKKPKKAKKVNAEKSSEAGGFSFNIPGFSKSDKEGKMNGEAPAKQEHFIEPQSAEVVYQQRDFGQTVILNEENETTLLEGTTLLDDMEESGYLVMISSNQEYPLTNRKTVLGSSDDCDVVLTRSVVSRHHAFVEHTQQGFYLVDNSSTNGTFLNGIKVQPDTQHELHHGDQIRLANERIEFQIR